MNEKDKEVKDVLKGGQDTGGMQKMREIKLNIEISPRSLPFVPHVTGYWFLLAHFY